MSDAGTPPTDDLPTPARPAIDELLEVMRRLRDPVSGCPWDIAQTFRTIAPYTLEEAYEVIDAIERDDLDDLRDELGDLLLQVVYHARMAEETGAFAFEDVARGIVGKMLRRHPHVFGERAPSGGDPESLHRRWEAIKARERAEREAARQPDRQATGVAPEQATAPPSALDGVARALPALMRAAKLQSRAARVGFDWPDPAPVRAKLLEELAEVDEAAACGSADALEDEIGDLLFSAVNLSRHYKIDPEAALTRASAKFERRFRAVEALAAERASAPDTLGIDALEALWREAKARIG